MSTRQMQDVFWDVATNKDRGGFLKGNQASKFDAYRKGCGKPVRVNRDHKSSLFASKASR